MLTTGPQNNFAFNRRHIKIYDGCDIDKSLENIPINDKKKYPNHLNHYINKEAREIEQALEQELTSFHETLTNFGDKL